MSTTWVKRVKEAQQRIAPWVITTPLVPALELGRGNSEVFFKLETVQVTHSFKVRGAFSKLTKLTEEERRRGQKVHPVRPAGPGPRRHVELRSVY